MRTGDGSSPAPSHHTATVWADGAGKGASTATRAPIDEGQGVGMHVGRELLPEEEGGDESEQERGGTSAHSENLPLHSSSFCSYGEAGTAAGDGLL